MTVMAAEAVAPLAEGTEGAVGLGGPATAAAEGGGAAPPAKKKAPGSKPPASSGGGGGRKRPASSSGGGDGGQQGPTGRQVREGVRRAAPSAGGGGGGGRRSGNPQNRFRPGSRKPEVKSLKLKGPSKGGAAHKLVIAEFIICVVLIGITPILMRSPTNGHIYVPNDFVRLSAVCLLFFVLALLANSPQTSRFAAAFGALVTLGVAFNASQSLTAIGNVFGAAKSTSGLIDRPAEGTAKVTTASYTPVDLSANPTTNAQAT